MCRWMGLHFYYWIDYHGVAFSIELLEWGLILGVRQFFVFTVSKRTRMFVLRYVNKVDKLGSRKLHICLKVTKMESIQNIL